MDFQQWYCLTKCHISIRSIRAKVISDLLEINNWAVKTFQCGARWQMSERAQALADSFGSEQNILTKHFLLAVDSHLCARRSYLSFLLQDFSSSPPFILLLRPNIFQTDSIVQFYTNICWEEFLLQTYYLCSIYRFLFHFVLNAINHILLENHWQHFYSCCEFVSFLIEHWILSFTSTLFSTGSWNWTKQISSVTNKTIHMYLSEIKTLYMSALATP